ncbi:Altered inheritance of mitochondria protein 1 [Lasiodiplodia theobromae]|uniref:Altered inheritance of mitochondria protein 1 n=1 Tax=Lasiodiplodia theobromae TaxID=45133 RepID=A0A5N5CUH9_9PEZI|nr:Altered inheritance of mitochondria protein 1 [Lasiodiplodia theobromae]
MAPSRAASRIAASAALSTRRCAAAAASAHTPLMRSYTQLLFSHKAPTPRPAPARAAAFAPGPAAARRCMSSSAAPEPPDYLSEGELHVFNKIKDNLDPVRLEVQDISGGCGSMYALDIESPKFKGMTVIKQHKLVNEILKDEIKGWHGVQLRTKAAA